MFKKILLILILFIIFNCNNNSDLIIDFVRFDKAFIPVLVLTNSDKLDAVIKANETLNFEWNLFKRKLYNFNSDEAWKKDFKQIEMLMQKSNKNILDNILEDSHKNLEGVRYIFFNMRNRMEIDYYPDYLTIFHDHMKIIYHKAIDKKENSFDDNDVKMIKELLPELKKTWDLLRNKEFDSEIFQFNASQMEKMEEFFKAEDEAIRRLENSIKFRSSAKIVRNNAIGIKSNYSGLFKLFGDFNNK